MKVLQTLSTVLSLGSTMRVVPRRGLLQGGAALGVTGVLGMSAGAGATEPPPSTELKVGGITRLGTEDLMAAKEHGTTSRPVQEGLRWGTDRKTADRICSFNRHFAEHAGYWKTTDYLKEVSRDTETTYYDSVSGARAAARTATVAVAASHHRPPPPTTTLLRSPLAGKPLFVAPRGRTMEAFLKESNSHGWPSFRQEEVVWENVRVLGDGEAVSVDGTHLGHNLPDGSGNRCAPPPALARAAAPARSLPRPPLTQPDAALPRRSLHQPRLRRRPSGGQGQRRQGRALRRQAVPGVSPSALRPGRSWSKLQT